MTETESKRRAPRTSVLMRAAISIESGPVHSFRVTNISATGMAGKSDHFIPSGTRVEVGLGPELSVAGRVARSSGNSFAVEFNAPINPDMTNMAPKKAAPFEVSSLHIVAQTARRPRIKL